VHPHAPEMSPERPMESPVMTAIRRAGWFTRPGAFVLVDGQYGSTGKGLAASLFAQAGLGQITHVTTNAGPNSGHTAYIRGEKVMTQQLPIAAVALADTGYAPITYLNAGAILDPFILADELARLKSPLVPVVHPAAAVIDPDHRTKEQDSPDIRRIASTGKGVGAALASKILRENNVAAKRRAVLPGNIIVNALDWDWSHNRVFVETAQGFSLGLNEARFHPFTTSRECTVMQALADARIPILRVRGVCATYRTFPIRVGNTAEGQSGSHYPDQVETSWEALGLAPELTSVTQRVRRVFTWSRQQFRESVAANEPDTLFLNFMNYLRPQDVRPFVEQTIRDYRQVMHLDPALVLLGYGPKPEDVQTWW